MSLKTTRAVKPAPKHSTPSSATAPSNQSSAQEREFQERIQNDLTSLGQKINLLQSSSSSSNIASSSLPFNSAFVSNLRNIPGRDWKDQKIFYYESFLEKIIEYDKLILTKTLLEQASNAPVVRRKNSIMNDLNFLPTHFRITDRLQDYFNQAKRVTVLRQGGGGNGLPPTIPETNSGSVKEIEKLNEKINILTKKNEEMTKKNEKKVIEMNEDLKKSKNNEEKLNKEIEQLKKNIVEMEKKFSEKSDIDLKEKEENERKAKELKDKEDSEKLANEAKEKAEKEEKEKADKERIEREKQAQSIKDEENQKELLKISQKFTEELKELRVLYEEECKKNADLESKLSNLQSETSLSGDKLQSLLLESKEKEQLIESLEIKLENEIKLTQKVLSLIYQKANNIKEYREEKVFSDIPSDYAQGFIALENSVKRLIGNFEQEINLLISVKNVLEADNQTLTLQKDLIQQDFFTINDQHEALKAAYHSLSYESATVGIKSDSKEKDTIIEKLNKELNLATNENSKLKLEMSSMNYQDLILEMEKKLNDTIQAKLNLEKAYKDIQDELNYYKKQCEKLKNNFKELNSSNNITEKNFLDSFEEVMKDEMMNMKFAFEKKLRDAKDSSEELRKKHQSEIILLQEKIKVKPKLNFDINNL